MPLFESSKAYPVIDSIGQKADIGATVKGRPQGFETFLASSVPDLEGGDECQWVDGNSSVELLTHL